MEKSQRERAEKDRRKADEDGPMGGWCTVESSL